MSEQVKGNGRYNVAVIGGGTAGLVTSAGTVGLGGRAALIEAGKMGGDCLNYGCVPSKTLISSAKLIERIRHAKKMGLSDMEPSFRFEDVFARMRERRAKIEPHDSVERFEILGRVSQAEGEEGGLGKQAQADDGEPGARSADNSHQD